MNKAFIYKEGNILIKERTLVDGEYKWVVVDTRTATYIEDILRRPREYIDIPDEVYTLYM